jgi:hypothetical protein
VADGSREPSLAQEAAAIGFADQLRCQEFQGDPSAAVEIFRGVDLTHPASAQQTFDSVMPELSAVA